MPQVAFPLLPLWRHMEKDGIAAQSGIAVVNSATIAIICLFFIRSLFLFHASCSHVDTLGAEKKSGVPYIVCCRVPFGLAQLLGTTALPFSVTWDALPYRSSEVLTSVPAAHALPKLWPGGEYSMPLFAAQSRHEEPYPPMSKINPAFPFILPFTGNAEKYTPFPRRFQAGNAVFGNCAERLAQRARPTRCGLRGRSLSPFGRDKRGCSRCWFCARYVNYSKTCRGGAIVTPRRAGGGWCARWAM